MERTVGLIRLRHSLSCRPLTLIVYGNGHVKRTIRESPTGGEEEREKFSDRPRMNHKLYTVKCKKQTKKTTKKKHVCPVSGLASESLLVLAHLYNF